MPRNFRTYFLRVRTDGLEFYEMLQEVAAIRRADRTRVISESPVRLTRLDQSQKSNGILSGDLERLQMENLPTRGKIQEESHALDLEDDEGLGHQTAFVYDATNRVLAIQSNITGVGVTRFKYYLYDILGLVARNIELEFEVIMLPPDETDKAFAAGAAFKKLTFSVTNPHAAAETLANLEGHRPIMSTMLQTPLGDGDSVQMTVTLSVGQSRARLDTGVVQRFLRLATRRGTGLDVDKLVANGTFEGENQELNFLQAKLSNDQAINTRDRTLGFPERRRLVSSAVAERRDVLNRLFRRRAVSIP